MFGAQYYLLEQLGFRKLVDTTFIMGSLVSEDTDREDLERGSNLGTEGVESRDDRVLQPR